MSINQVTTVPTNNENTAGSFSTQGTMKSLYPESPIHKGELSPSKLIQMAQEHLLNGQVKGNGEALDSNPDFPNFDRDFTGAPVMADVEFGGQGQPASPYVPNLTSPGEGNMDPSNQAAMPEEYQRLSPKKESWGMGDGSSLDPNVSSQQISGQKIKGLEKGRSVKK